MAGDWIKFEHATLDKPEVIQMAELLEISQEEVVGRLLRLWCWADAQTIDGDGVPVTSSFVDRVTFLSGFADAMRTVGWLTGREGRLSIPNFVRHNGQSAKQRASAAKRAKDFRANAKTSRSRNAPDVTQSAPEKRREEKNKPPPPTPSPRGSPEADAQAAPRDPEGRRRLEEEVIRLGVDRSDCVAMAISNGVSTEQIEEVIAYWNTWRIVNGWQPGALHSRIARAHPAMSVKQGWPEPTKAKTSEVALEKQRAEEQARREDQQRTHQRNQQERERLEAEQGARFDALSDDQVLAQAADTSPYVLKHVKEAGREKIRNAVRIQLLRQLEKCGKEKNHGDTEDTE